MYFRFVGSVFILLIYTTYNMIDFVEYEWEALKYYGCVACWKKAYETFLVVKLPEMVWLCSACSEKYPDDKVKEWWWDIYVLWKWWVIEE